MLKIFKLKLWFYKKKIKKKNAQKHNKDFLAKPSRKRNLAKVF